MKRHDVGDHPLFPLQKLGFRGWFGNGDCGWLWRPRLLSDRGGGGISGAGAGRRRGRLLTGLLRATLGRRALRFGFAPKQDASR